MFRTLRALLFSPGTLSLAHMQGVRRPYMKPVTLFVVLNVLFFLFSPITDFALPLDNQGMQMYGDHVQAVIDREVAKSGNSFDDLAARYDVLTQLVAKSIVILSVPFLVPFVWLANPGGRYFLIDHTVFALHLYGFVLVWPIIVDAVASGLYFAGLLEFVPGFVATLLILGPLYGYIFLAQRRMYGGSPWLVPFRAMAVFAGLVLSHFIYRYLQFWIVWLQIT